MTVVSRLLIAEAAAFAAAALVHLGILGGGAVDAWAAGAESIIAVVLLTGALVTWRRPAWARRAAIVAQAFALIGTLIGLQFLIRLAPDRALDIAFHLGIGTVLAAGLVLAARTPGDVVRGTG